MLPLTRSEKSLLAGTASPRPSARLAKSCRTLLVISFICFLSFYYSLQVKLSFGTFRSGFYPRPVPFRNYCDGVSPISPEEFRARQNALARELHVLNASAYIAEPSADAYYFGNISQESWHLSERPFLLIISHSISNATIQAKITILTPKFEASRAKLLNIPGENIEFVEWEEDEDPYPKAFSSLSDVSENSLIFLSESTRLFIRDGLQSAAPSANVRSAPYSIRVLRERKSPTEIALLRCVNEATLLAIRHVREELHFGIRQSDVLKRVSQVLLAAGLTDPYGLVLFGENAARPHGGPVDKELVRGDLILFDIGAKLRGYTSDVTRTFALEASEISPQYIAIWNVVKAAQESALSAAISGTEGQDVDKAARNIIVGAGYGRYFTHRLGHGIGLEGHENPYLRGGSKDVLMPGHTFSNEPGIYMDGKAGIRLEDCFVIQEDGRAAYLTEGVGGAAKDPWHI